MAKNTFLDWDQTASNNTDVGGIGILGTNAVSNFDDALRTVMAQLRAGVDGEMAYVTKAANYTAVANDNNAYLRFTAAATLSLTAVATLGANWHIYVKADGADVIVDPNASETINGATTLTVRNGETALIVSSGTAFYASVMSNAFTSYVVKTANYTALDADYNSTIRFTSAATLAFDVTANLRTNWRIEVWNDSTGLVTIDPDSTNTINGSVSIVIQPGQRIEIYKTSSTTFQGSFWGDTQAGPQLQGYLYGLSATTNSGTPSTNIDVAAGAAASSATPYYLIQLLSSITKNTNTSWAVGTGNGSLDTGSIANSTYYGYLIQRSDTGVVDVLTSLSSTSPTMPTNYDRRSPALFTFTRTAGVNSAPAALGRYGINYSTPASNPNTASVLFAGIPPGAKRITAHFYSLNPSASALPVIRMGVAGSVVSSGYLSNISQSNGGAALANATDSTGMIVATGNITNTNPAFGRVIFDRLSPSLNFWEYSLYDLFSSSTINGWGSGVIALAGDPDRIQFTTLAGTALLNGTMNISWEF